MMWNGFGILREPKIISPKIYIAIPVHSEVLEAMSPFLQARTWPFGVWTRAETLSLLAQHGFEVTTVDPK